MTTTPTHAPGGSLDRPIGRGPFARLYRGQTHYDFINRWRYWFALSGTVIALGLVALFVSGLNFSIDFRGGTVWEVPTTASVATVRADLSGISPLIAQSPIVTLTNRQTGKVNIEVEAASTITGNAKLVADVSNELAAIAHTSVDTVSIESIGPSWGSDISDNAIKAVIVFLVLISICISVYFESKMAIAALVALLHDMLVTVGIYALSGFQVSPDTVIAFLTVLGYSLYDTIVVFDKVKENTIGLASTNRVTYTDVVNLSMNQVLARSINTSFVAIMPVFCILVIGSWILGASALNDFGLALFIGLMSGAYSSIFIASPILALLKEREPRYTEIRKRLAAFPQSRQFLTPSTVAGGIMYGTSKVVPPPTSGRGYGRAGAAGAGAAGDGATGDGATGRSGTGGSSGSARAGGTSGSARAGAGTSASSRAGAGKRTSLGGGRNAAGRGNGAPADEAVAGPVVPEAEFRGPGDGGGGGPYPGDMAELGDEPIIAPGASGASEPAVRSASSAPGAPNGPSGARRTPPRPRKKVPRRR
jgi:preprotein translocase subunit SecF